jgi:hypothetical protein
VVRGPAATSEKGNFLSRYYQTAISSRILS